MKVWLYWHSLQIFQGSSAISGASGVSAASGAGGVGGVGDAGGVGGASKQWSVRRSPRDPRGCLRDPSDICREIT